MAYLEQAVSWPEGTPAADEFAGNGHALGARTTELTRPKREYVADAVQRYLHEIGQVPLLSAAEERALAVQIERGVAAAQRLETDERLDPQIQAELRAEVAKGAHARHQLIQANLRLVVSIAKKYVGHGMSLLDLVQEGNIGLMRAVEKFDYHRGHRFTTYATWWIRQAIIRALAERSRTIRLPVHVGEKLGQLSRITAHLAQVLERQPTSEEIAMALGVAPSRIKDLLASAQTPESLEKPMRQESEQALKDTLANHTAQTPIEIAAQRLLRQDLLDALESLSVRERQILLLRYGMTDGKTRTLEEVGKELALTRERVRQLEAQALRRLRAEIDPQLRAYLE